MASKQKAYRGVRTRPSMNQKNSSGTRKPCSFTWQPCGRKHLRGEVRPKPPKSVPPMGFRGFRGFREAQHLGVRAPASSLVSVIVIRAPGPTAQAQFSSCPPPPPLPLLPAVLQNPHIRQGYQPFSFSSSTSSLGIFILVGLFVL